MLTISSGYDPLYLTRAVATGRENYYLSAVAEHGEPPGIWTGLGCPELGLPIGSEVDNKIMEALYGGFMDPRDPGGETTLGRAPSEFTGNDDKVAALIAQRARCGAGGDAGTPRPGHHAGAEGAARRGVLLRRDVLGAQVGQPAARVFAGQGPAGPRSWPRRRGGAVDGACADGVGRHHGRQPGDAGLPATGGGLQPGRVPRQGLGPVRRRAPVGDRLVPPAHQQGQRPAAPRAQRHLEPGAARRPAGLPPRRPARLAHAGRRGAVRGQARRRCHRRADPRGVPDRPARRARRSRGRTGTGGRSPGSPRIYAISSPRGAARSARASRS